MEVNCGFVTMCFHDGRQPISEYLKAKTKTAVISSPDHIKETPEGGWKGVGLRSPEQSHMGPGLAHVIEGREGIVQDHPHRDQIRNVLPLGQLLSMHGLGQVLTVNKSRKK